MKLATSGQGDVMVTMNRVNGPGQPYRMDFGTISLKEVANHERPMPASYLSADGFDVTPAFLHYIAPLIGELPTYTALAARRAEA